MCEQPLAPASRTMSGHRRAGIPRARQELIVEAGKPSSAETEPVPPKSSIAESAVRDMDAMIVRNSRTCQAFAYCETTLGQKNVPIELMGERYEDIGRRLIRTREALDFTGHGGQSAFCKAIGVSKTKYNPFETGKRPITLAVAIKIRKRFAVPLDWIYCADPSGLPQHVYQKLNRTAA